MISLERRFVTGLAIALLLAFGFLFWGSVAAVRSLSESYVQTRLEHDAESLIAAFGANPHGQVKLREGRVTPIYQQPLSGHYFVILLDDAVQIRSRSLWDESLPVDPEPLGSVTFAKRQGPGGQRLITRSAGYEKAGRRFTLMVAEDITPMTAQIRRFQIAALGLLGLALVLIVLIQRYVLRRGFQTLDTVRDEMQRVSNGQRQQIGELGPSEVRPLTAEVNRLLQQLQQRLQRSRQALGNLAHALKAPLSRLTQDIEALPLSGDDRQRLGDLLTRITQLIERELKRARIGGNSAGQRFNPARDVPPLIEAVGQLHRAQHIEISTAPLPDTRLPQDYEDMLELLGNLLDNACKWAKQRASLSIVIDRSLTIRVADDGPGVDDDRRDELLHRGVRLDEHKAGHGLGLAIVKDLVDDYGGQLALSRSATLGGLEVVVTLPLHQPGQPSQKD